MKNKRKEILLLMEVFDLELCDFHVKDRVEYFNPPLDREQVLKRMK